MSAELARWRSRGWALFQERTSCLGKQLELEYASDVERRDAIGYHDQISWGPGSRSFAADCSDGFELVRLERLPALATPRDGRNLDRTTA
jgi:hypothetical protein